MSFLRLSFFALAAAVVAPALAQAVSPGQIDTFETGTFQGWTNGGQGFGFETPLPLGGPAGAADHFLSVASGSFGGKSRWIIFNRSQWLGNYLSAGVRAVSMDLKNQATTGSVNMRLAIMPTNADQGGGAGSPGYVSTEYFSLPANGQWHRAIFLLNSAEMTLVSPPEMPPTLNEVLSDVQEVRLLVQSVAVPTSIIGDETSAKIGVDNVTAIPLGDFDLNGTRNAADIPSMLTALADLNQFKVTHLLDDKMLRAIGDVNGDNQVTNTDLQSLLDLLKAGSGQGALQAIPEPVSIIPAACALAAVCWIRLRRIRS